MSFIIESIVDAVVGKLGEALLDPIVKEAKFLWGVDDKVRQLQREFRTMQSFLIDADAKQVADERVKNWVREVREVAMDAEDAIDIFACKITPAAPVSHEGWRGKLQRYGFTKFIALHKLGRKIDGINATIANIAERKEKYDIQSIRSEIQSSFPRVSHPHVVKQDYVGLEEQLNSLIGHLIAEEQPCFAVSLVGMGGLGKTTLAKRAYNHEAVMGCFSHRAWVFVSQQYSVRELLLSIGCQCSFGSDEELGRMTPADLSSKIFKSLTNTRYLIVLDDIWNSEAWDGLEQAFPDESNGSRILLTTRIKEVARHARSTAHELPLLKEHESWQLFCKKAFPEQEIGCPLALEPIGREIVKKCGDLPLAIVVMGGLLWTKEASEWQMILNRIHWQFEQKESPVFDVLSLSYNHLPYGIKPCFLYLASLPGDYDFPADRLIRLWAAEGFLQQRGQATPEEVGEAILNDLISRNLIQVAGTSSSGLIESCRMHDLLRDLCAKKAAEEGFIEVLRRSSTPPSAFQWRRLALHGEKVSTSAYLISHTKHHRLRSVFLFNENQKDEILETRQQQLLFKSFELLRVLDLHGILIRELPGAIGELFLLRYLRSSNSRIESLPSAMANLRYLQTLDVERWHVKGVLDIPNPVKKMLQGLRHLRLVTYVDSFGRDDEYRNVEPYLPKNFFDIISECDVGYVRYEEMVGLERTKASSCVSGLSVIDESVITASSFSSMLQRPLLTSCHLFIDGKLSRLPDQPCGFPSNLYKLKLLSSDLEMDPLPLLEKLENLRFLVLDIDSYLGKEMACSPRGFPQLQSLHLRKLYNLEGWRVDEEAMPCLSYLQITSCKRLKMLPEGLKYLKKLKTLEISEMRRTFTDRLREQVGEDWYKIRHIPSIKIGKELNE